MPADDDHSQVRRFAGAEEDPVTERLLGQPYQPLAAVNPELFKAVVAELPADGIDWSEAVRVSADWSVEIVIDGRPFWIATTDGTPEHIVSTIRSALENLN